MNPELEMKNVIADEQFKAGMRSVYRADKFMKVGPDGADIPNAGKHLKFMGDSRPYVVGNKGELRRAQPKPKGKKAVKAAKRARHHG